MVSNHPTATVTPFLNCIRDVAIKSSQKRVEKEGQGYAFICLYALECYKLPILESYRRLQKGAARYKHHYEKGGPS